MSSIEKELRACRVAKYEPMEFEGKVIRENEYLVDLYTYDNTDLWCRCVFKYDGGDEDCYWFDLTDILEYTHGVHLTYSQELLLPSKTMNFIKFMEDNEVDVLREIRKLVVSAGDGIAALEDDLDNLIEEEERHCHED